MAALAKETAYSKSSWERYLNGKQLPARQAVEALCARAQEPPERLLALWELADQEWSGRARRAARPAAGGSAAQPDSDRLGQGGPPDGRAGGSGDGVARTRLRVRAVVAAVCVAGLASWVGMVVLSTGAGPSVRRASPPSAPGPGCHAQTCTGKSPQLMGCGMPGRAHTLGPQRIASTGAHFEIRYSEQCGAAWARMWRSHTGDAVEVSVPNSSPQRVRAADKNDDEGYLFTPMIRAGDLTGLRVCFEPAGTGRKECFPR